VVIVVLGCFLRWWLVADIGGRWAYAYLVVNGAALWVVYPIVHCCLLFALFLSICPTSAFKGGLLRIKGGVAKEKPI
jgi:hypothetical protein